MLKPFPICQIIPPHILNNIVERGKKEQRARAMQSLTLFARIGGQRDITSLLPILAVAGTKRRTIYNTHRSETLPGTRVRGEGGKPVKNRAVNEAYDYCGDVDDFYKAVCDRNSVDDQGLRLDSTVHYGEDYDNAFWNGSQMVYGDGDGEIFQRFTKCIDVIGHEREAGKTALNDRRIDYIFGQPEVALLRRAEVLRDTAVGKMDHWPLLVEVAL